MRFNISAIKAWCAMHERSAAWLARKADIGSATMKRLMAGHNPSLDTIGAIAKVTGLRINDLVVETQEAQRAS